jgi:predicted aspartyl protease
MNFAVSAWKYSAACSGLLAANLALAFVAGAAQAESGAGSSLGDYLKRVGYLPVTLKNGEHGKLLAEGVLAGKKCLFLVDTGWGRTALDEGAARGLKSLGELGGTLDDSFWGKLSDPAIVVMDKLTLGGAQFLNQPAKVMKLQMDYISLEFDGILGCDFLFRNYCLIDCWQRKLYVRSAQPSDDVTSAIETTLRSSGFTDVPINVKYGLTVDAKVNGETLKLLVDTGATFSALDSALAKRLRLAAVKEDEPRVGTLIKREWRANIVGVGKIGAHKMWVATVKTWEVGSLQWTNVHVGVMDLKSWRLAESGTRTEEVRGMLGREMLTARGALIDYHSRKLWFRPE